MTSDDLVWLQGWYRQQCNGTWEHAHGIAFDTIDNPGWQVIIDLTETSLQNAGMSPLRRDDGPNDWLAIEVKESKFVGHGDPGKLTQIIAVFRAWAEPQKARG